ncbi:hypothetical protein D046_2758B, partial [Vibrio parahaemolyticus V-223/04]
QRLSFPL